jgi:hypothetical protein
VKDILADAGGIWHHNGGGLDGLGNNGLFGGHPSLRKCGTLQFDDGPDQSWAAINSADNHPAYIAGKPTGCFQPTNKWQNLTKGDYWKYMHNWNQKENLYPEKNPGVNFATAKQYCEAEGARMCTVDEIYFGVPRKYSVLTCPGSYLWSSTDCGENSEGVFVTEATTGIWNEGTLAVFSTIRRRPQVGPGTGKNGVFSWYSKVNFVHSTHACTFGFAILLGCRKVNPGILFRVKVLLLVPVMHIFPIITFSKILPLVRRLKTSSRFSCDVSWMIIS